ncbi:MAG: tRNA uridine-5-carboxymethylaminomethyl(34) synthesis GTPase MnmE [Spirochaetales bacterium]|nr:tRNA uridine-5-carboxymethylaminomethyl(34) synthesis GTPase MnmE [Spirochaetales bacterium]
MVKESAFDLHDPIVALATPWGESAIAVIRTSGEDCIKKIAGVFKGTDNLSNKKSHTVNYGTLYNPKDGELVDEVLAAVYHSPHSYTGEDAVELFCHGSPAALQKTLKLLYEQGFRQADAGEFTLRAFLNGKIDLTKAEAVNEIIRAKSDKARRLALHRLAGSIEKTINSFKTRLVDMLSALEVMIDYPDEQYEHNEFPPQEFKKLLAEVHALLATYKAGRIYQEGVGVALAGRTNSGKSTLFNLMLKEDRSIVSDVHGTTRDFIEGSIAIKGIPVRLYDTAGLRSTDHPVEAEGIRRTDKIITNADIIIYLIDGSLGVCGEDEKFINQYKSGGRLLVVWNKCDLSGKKVPKAFIPISSLTGQGLQNMEKAIVFLLLGSSPLESDGPVIDSLRQKQSLEQALAALKRVETGYKNRVSYDLLAVDIKEALDAFGHITGQVTSEEILRAMFSKFCVGK